MKSSDFIWISLCRRSGVAERVRKTDFYTKRREKYEK